MLTNEFLMFFLGTSILASLIISKGADLLKFPLIVGYIIAGAIIGPDLLGIISNELNPG